MKTWNMLAFAFSLVTLGPASAWADGPARVPAKVEGDAPSGGKTCKAAKKLGMEELHAGRYVEAARYLTICLQGGSDDAEVKEALREAKKHIGTVKILLNETDARVLIDGEHFWYKLDPETFLTPGSHRISAKKTGFKPHETVIDVKAGEEQVVSIWLLREEDELYRKVIGIPVQVQMSFDGKMEPPPEPPKWPIALMIGGFSGFGVGGAMVVTGVVMAVDDKTGNDYKLWRGITIGGGILGCFGLAAGLIGWGAKPTPPAPVFFSPVMNNQTTGVSVSGQW